MSTKVGNLASVWIKPDASITRPNNATAYSANQTIGDATKSLFTWTNFFPNPGQYSGLMTGCVLYASVASIATSNLGNITGYFYNTTPSFSPLADQQTFQTLFADEPPVCIGTVKFSTYVIGGTGSTAMYSYGALDVSPMPIASTTAPKQNLHLVLVATAAFTPAANTILTPFVSAVFD